MAFTIGVAEETDDFGVFGVAKDNDFVALAGVVFDFSGDDADVGAGGVVKGESEGFEVLAAFGGDAVGTDDDDRVVFFFFFDLDVGLALVIADFADAFSFHAFHHLAVVDKGAVGVDGAVFIAFGGEVTGDVNGAFDAPAEAGTLGSEDFHGKSGLGGLLEGL